MNKHSPTAMKKKPASITINLLPRDPFFATPIGIFLQWALSAGRYIVIFTELVVIISFAARFTLDRQLTDLNTKLYQQKNMILSYGTLEPRFRAAQSKIATVEGIDTEVNITDVFENLSLVTPSDVSLSQLSIGPSTVNITGSTLSQYSFNLLINNLQLSQRFFNISVSKVESGGSDSPGFEFSILANTKEVKKVAPVETKTEEKQNLLQDTDGGI